MPIVERSNFVPRILWCPGMNDDDRPPRVRDPLSDQADAAHEAAIDRLKDDVRLADRYNSLAATATNPKDLVGYRVHRPNTGSAPAVAATPLDAAATAQSGTEVAMTQTDVLAVRLERSQALRDAEGLGAKERQVAAVGALGALAVDSRRGDTLQEPKKPLRAGVLALAALVTAAGITLVIWLLQPTKDPDAARSLSPIATSTTGRAALPSASVDRVSDRNAPMASTAVVAPPPSSTPKTSPPHHSESSARPVTSSSPSPVPLGGPPIY